MTLQGVIPHILVLGRGGEIFSHDHAYIKTRPLLGLVLVQCYFKNDFSDNLCGLVDCTKLLTSHTLPH